MHERVLRTWTADATAFAEVLARHDPSWGTATFPLADGVAVLCGPGMYVNAAMAVGLDREVIDSEFERFEARCATVGVDPAIEVSPFTRQSVTSAAIERGYLRRDSRVALRRQLDDLDQLPLADSTLLIEAGSHQLDVWQATSRMGWGRDTPATQRASDAFAAAAAEVDGDGFVLARDSASGEPVACASLTVRDAIATLGGMSTVPAARRRGVQAALIHHRLRAAASAGCTLATTTAAPRGDSMRNLVRHGFEPWFAIDTLVRRPAT